MIMSLDKKSLVQYTKRQLSQFFPDDSPSDEMDEHIDEVLGRVERCFSAIHNKYYRFGSETYFNHLHSDQYSMYLYYLSNTLYRNKADESLCEKVFYLNKALNGIDVFYAVELPDIFLVGHPVGTVLGRAIYSDYFLAGQKCTVGNNHGIYPTFGKYVVLYAGASVIGNCRIGDNCKIAAGSLIMDQDLDSNSIYIGTPDNHVIKENRQHNPVWD